MDIGRQVRIAAWVVLIVGIPLIIGADRVVVVNHLVSPVARVLSHIGLRFHQAVFLLMAISGYFLLAQRGKQEAGVPLPLEYGQRRFPGFEIRPGQFEQYKGDIIRVNADGLRVNLKDWHFDEASGEFYRITDREDGEVIFETDNKGQRFVNYVTHKNRTNAALIASLIIAIMFTGLGLASSDFFLRYFILFPVAVLAAIFALPLLLLKQRRRKDHAVGPEPLKRVAVELSSQQPHGPQDDDGTI